MCFQKIYFYCYLLFFDNCLKNNYVNIENNLK